MTDVSSKIFFCYAWEDLARIKQIILETEHEINAKISSKLEFYYTSKLDDTLSTRIAECDIFIVFISKAAKQSSIVQQCVARASHLNKNILPLHIDKKGIFNFLKTKKPKEFKFRSKNYEYTIPKSKAEFFSQLKASFGLIIEGGDAFGALVHVVTDFKAQIKRYGQIIGYSQPDMDCQIRLAKGRHLLQIEHAELADCSITQPINIKNNEQEDFITVTLNQLFEINQDPVGSIVHIITDCKARIKRYGKIIGIAAPDTDCKICLAKGTHKLQIEDAKWPSIHISRTINISDNKSQRFCNTPLTKLFREKYESINATSNSDIKQFNVPSVQYDSEFDRQMKKYRDKWSKLKPPK